MKKNTHEYHRHFDETVYDKQYFEGDGSTSGYMSYMDAKGIVQDQFKIIDKVMGGRVEGWKHLDVACAYGFGNQVMREIGWQSDGIDVSEFAISKAKELAPDYRDRYQVMDALKLVDAYEDFKDYDLVTAIEFFEHIESSDAEKIIEGMATAGKWGFFVINASTYPDQPHDTDGDHGHLNHHSMSWWIEKIAKHGQIDFEAMFEFSKAAETYNPGVHWHNRCVVVKFD